MLTIPEHWAQSCSSEPQLPLLGLPGRSMEFRDPIALAEQLGNLLPLRSCDPAQRASASAPFQCHTGALTLGALEIVALWGTGLRAEIDGTEMATFIIPYRGEGHFRIDGHSFLNRSGRTLLLVPPGAWRTRNDVLGGVTRTPLVLGVESLGHALPWGPYGEEEITILEGEVIPAIQQCLARIDDLDQWLLAQQELLHRCQLEAQREVLGDLRLQMA